LWKGYLGNNVFGFVFKFKTLSPPLRNYLFQIEIKSNETSIKGHKTKELSENDGT
jgi:hypothetical protein